MHIVRFEAENYKRLKAVEIVPDGNTVVIAGRNAQGKSSVLDAIWATLAGKDGAKQTTRPIRDGEVKARVVIELEDLRIERRWTQAGSNLTVGPRDGKAKFNSPQAILDGLIGKLSFDPLAFANADAKAQRAQLLALTGLQEQVDLIDGKRAGAFRERTDVNRDLKRLQARYDALGEDVPEMANRVNTAVLAEELVTARRRDDLARQWSDLNQQIHDLQVRLDEVAAEGRRLPGTRGIDELTTLLEGADAANRRAEQYEAWVELGREVEDARHASEELTQRISEFDQDKVDLLARADLPVDGLSVDDEGVLLNGIPLAQASAAERLRISVAMAMAANPEVRVICIKDASLLDEESMAMLTKLAVDKDYQIWYERVGNDAGEVGVVIEDGMVIEP